MVGRRKFLALGVGVCLAGCSESADSETPTSRPGTDTQSSPAGDGGTSTTEQSPDDTPGGDAGLPVALETITDRPETPLALEDAPDGSAYIVDRPGRLYRLSDGEITTALDLTDTVVTGSERGLLGLALHPEFDSNGRLYLRYSAPPRSGTPSSYSHTFVLAEFEAASDGTVDSESERTLLEISEPQGNHNSGPIAFGPDGYLYVGVGDGGAGGDRGEGHVSDWYDGNPGGNGQDLTENLLGSLLRIDVDSRSDGKPYAVPEDNPLVGEAGLDEQYAWGLRNPWGLSFDGEDLYLADVGQNEYEEVNHIVNGGNYGWNVREGAHCFGAESCPAETPDGDPLRDPVIEYPHGGAEVSGVAIVGGHIYRGSAIPGLTGEYVFGDLQAGGQLFVATPADEGLWPTAVLELAESSRGKLNALLSIERDRADELYALTRSGVHQLVPSG